LSDFAAYIPVVNRFDLLANVIDSLPGYVHEELTVIDNSGKRLNLQGVGDAYSGLVPMTFTQSMNWEFKDAILRGKKFALHMHSDAVIPEGAVDKLFEKAREIDASGRKWGVIYTFYDIMAVYNPLAAEDVGGYDTVFPAYFSDCDYYRRLRLAGWETIDTGIEVGHIGSQTINSDPELKALNNITFPLYRQYYIAKWGGEPGHETFASAFGREEMWNRLCNQT
jgi:hypothetical protein